MATQPTLSQPSTLPARSLATGTLALAGALAAAYVVLPILLGQGFLLQLLVYAGIAAVSAIGLNLLTGNTGQVSLGTPFFMGVGAYAAGFFGQDLGLPFPLWMLACVALTVGLGAAIGPFALRLKGDYLVMVTFALVFIGQHVFNNWRSVTGGTTGRSILPPMSLGPIDLGALPGLHRDQSYFLLVWAIVAVVAVMARNLLRSRPGRALLAIRDREVTAEVVGVEVPRHKVTVFALSSGLAGLAGGLQGAFVQYTSPTEWGLLLGIQFLAMIAVGGVGNVLGSVIGALVITFLPYAVQAISVYVPGITVNPTDPGFVSVFAVNQFLFGALIIVFLTALPEGFAGLIRTRAR